MNVYEPKELVCSDVCCVFCLQSMTSASAGSTTVMRTPFALTWSEATAAPVSRATPATGQSAKVSTAVLLFLCVCHAHTSQYKRAEMLSQW